MPGDSPTKPGIFWGTLEILQLVQPHRSLGILLLGSEVPVLPARPLDPELVALGFASESALGGGVGLRLVAVEALREHPSRLDVAPPDGLLQSCANRRSFALSFSRSSVSPLSCSCPAVVFNKSGMSDGDATSNAGSSGTPSSNDVPQGPSACPPSRRWPPALSGRPPSRRVSMAPSPGRLLSRRCALAPSIGSPPSARSAARRRPALPSHLFQSRRALLHCLQLGRPPSPGGPSKTPPSSAPVVAAVSVCSKAVASKRGCTQQLRVMPGQDMAHRLPLVPSFHRQRQETRPHSTWAKTVLHI